MDFIFRKDSIIACNKYWQFPAITELYAYKKIEKFGITLNSNLIYFAFPWATLIDKKSKCIEDSSKYYEYAKTAAALKNPNETLVTVCQHIQLKYYLDFFLELGIKHIFWSHMSKDDLQTSSRINIHPFPLFPVNIPKDIFESREYLFSFVGAEANQWYLTKTRNIIAEKLSNKISGKIVLRTQWHYRDVVYNHQIENNRFFDKENPNDEKIIEYNFILRRSVFSLCPSGTGPNSIRLWESLGAGAIPVILADTYLPPGPMELWEEAAVFCPETEEAIAALPAKLESMAKDSALLERKRRAMRQLWLKYGPDCFVYDILKFMLEDESQAMPVAPTAKNSANWAGDSLALIAAEMAAGRVSKQEAASLIWRGLYTRSRSSPENLRNLLVRHPEIAVAANQTHSFLSAPNRSLADHKGLRMLPGLENLSAPAS